MPFYVQVSNLFAWFKQQQIFEGSVRSMRIDDGKTSIILPLGEGQKYWVDRKEVWSELYTALRPFAVGARNTAHLEVTVHCFTRSNDDFCQNFTPFSCSLKLEVKLKRDHLGPLTVAQAANRSVAEQNRANSCVGEAAIAAVEGAQPMSEDEEGEQSDSYDHSDYL